MGGAHTVDASAPLPTPAPAPLSEAAHLAFRGDSLGDIFIQSLAGVRYAFPAHPHPHPHPHAASASTPASASAPEPAPASAGRLCIGDVTQLAEEQLRVLGPLLPPTGTHSVPLLPPIYRLLAEKLQ
mmetsp:Transcript_21548/g.47945  ORF Transcript_21548/g.47945 Transcript_21548/m.47945 type:complete len:127 (+) Transcript_21548:3-383(+)